MAGPTPRDSNVSSWRPNALKILKQLGYDGVVFIPESQDAQRSSDYDQQMDWELAAMRRSDVILFWIPATPDTLPAYTTRVELGLQIHSGKVILGIPQGAYRTRYLERLASQRNIAVYCTLEETLNAAYNQLDAGAERSHAECLIPLEIWQTRHFQQWYSSQTSAGHSLEDVPNIEWVFRVGADKSFPLLLAIHVAMKVKGEERIKSNEAVIIRPSIVTVCVYCLGKTRNRDRFVLIKEYRTSALNAQGFVFELPGGSSFKPGIELSELAMEELEEETGMRFSQDRFRMVTQRQIVATLVANEALLMAIELEPAEMDAIAAQARQTYGNFSETEQTYLHVFTREQIMEGGFVDFVTLGQIALVGFDK
ncbi:nucleoside 2-deoxyribosyltransferase domain-containing protein [Oscillatoria sp. FACHB-1407]|uniref:nucleoside 2-deoxyribosyltransferase domain-containing protein n=1 Tax=Oscillatoria sp. FACHB-1407 TaxID=2692847 RepID=UPI001683DD7E|nr:nucleoside 2-deoxyribosyltransferase domain-containing protein [Oscillatoria sp. FACHB-1407]MBD2461346.1 nucleoside 2-deoxyribosyltransferase domain-containing protein [Oscillatoria sp. FACHB-1407]